MLYFKCDLKTLMGLAFLGDVSLVSRNRLLGLEIGKLNNFNKSLKVMNGYKPEGINSLYSIKDMIGSELSTPCIDSLYNIVFKNKKPDLEISNLIKKFIRRS